MMQSRHLIISGRVQGVGYRDWAVREAGSRRIDGWVRNRRDGVVEIVARGDEAELSRFIEACRSGPIFARIDNVLIREPEDGAAPIEAGFYMRETV